MKLVFGEIVIGAGGAVARMTTCAATGKFLLGTSENLLAKHLHAR